MSANTMNNSQIQMTNMKTSRIHQKMSSKGYDEANIDGTPVWLSGLWLKVGVEAHRRQQGSRFSVRLRGKNSGGTNCRTVVALIGQDENTFPLRSKRAPNTCSRPPRHRVDVLLTDQRHRVNMLSGQGDLESRGPMKHRRSAHGLMALVSSVVMTLVLAS